jgi:hypothetical protein
VSRVASAFLARLFVAAKRTLSKPLQSRLPRRSDPSAQTSRRSGPFRPVAACGLNARNGANQIMRVPRSHKCAIAGYEAHLVRTTSLL